MYLRPFFLLKYLYIYIYIYVYRRKKKNYNEHEEFIEEEVDVECHQSCAFPSALESRFDLYLQKYNRYKNGNFER